MAVEAGFDGVELHGARECNLNYVDLFRSMVHGGFDADFTTC
jgi:hypothetical protein